MPRFRDTELSLNPSVPRKERVKDPKNIMRSVDPAALEMLAKYNGSDISTGYSRYAAQQPQCAFGYEGVCCRICIQGPCRVKGLEGDKSKGICGARDYTIVARNIARAAAGGASAGCADAGRYGLCPNADLGLLVLGQRPCISSAGSGRFLRCCLRGRRTK